MRSSAALGAFGLAGHAAQPARRSRRPARDWRILTGGDDRSAEPPSRSGGAGGLAAAFHEMAEAQFMAESQDPELEPTEHPRIRAAVGQLRGLLVSGEELEAWAVQRRLFALTNRRTVVGATSGRLVVMHREVFGGFRPHDVRWQDLKDARLRVGVFGATLVVVFLGSSDLAVAGQTAQSVTVSGLRKEEAHTIYRFCQTQEQAWREKRRIRELEELRAKSGGIQLGSSPGLPAPTATPAGNEDPVARLQRAKDMLEKGLITDTEYEAIKARVVSSL